MWHSQGLKFIFRITLALSLLLVTNPLFATDTPDITSIRAYINKTFANKINISEDQLQQLSWIVKHKRRTYEMDMYVNPNSIHIEITRALTRLYCLQLLKTGGRDSYNKFVAAQLSNKTPNILTFYSFAKLSKHIQQLSDLDYELIVTSTILSAVSLSSEASRLAQEVLNINHLSNDNLEFLAATLRANPNIYPIAAKTIQNNTDVKKLLYVLFPPQTNFRHMLYTEGGVDMFKYLRTMIKHQYIKRNDLDLWYAYWITHIAGFRGHVTHEGSIYLTEPVFHAMTKLKSEIYEMLESPNHEPLITYLEYRAELLGFAALPKNERWLLAHLGGLMRLYTIDDGKRLRISFMQLPANQKQLINNYFQKLFSGAHQLSPTYGPALFANSLELNGRNIEQIVQIILPFYCKAVNDYAVIQQHSNHKAKTSLSFNKISATENVKKLLGLGLLNLEHINIGADGEVRVGKDDKNLF